MQPINALFDHFENEIIIFSNSDVALSHVTPNMDSLWHLRASILKYNGLLK